MKLTEKEFDTIIEALEHLPSRNAAANILTRLAVKAFTQKDEHQREKAEAKLAELEDKEFAEAKESKKICGIIAGKLYMMKEKLVEEQS
jgi:hypothetical protein